MPLDCSLLPTPSKETLSVAIILTFPASPFPWVPTSNWAPLVTASDPVVMLISPPFPTPSEPTVLKIPLEPPSIPTPSRETISLLLMLIFPAFPSPFVLAVNTPPLVIESDLVVMSMLPPLPTAPDSTVLKAELGLLLLLTPSKKTLSVAVILKFPAFPCPRVKTCNWAPPVTESDLVVMLILPALPTAPFSTVLLATVDNPSPICPSKTTVSVAVMFKLPAFPNPKVLEDNTEVFVAKKDLVVMLTSPPWPVAAVPTRVAIALEDIVTLSVVLISISPATSSDDPNNILTPAIRELLADISKFLALIAILPPPPASTRTTAWLLRNTFDRATPSGKFKRRLLPSILNPIMPGAANPPNSIRPPGACKIPPSNRTSPPTSVKVFPSCTCRPDPKLSLFVTLAWFTIFPPTPPYCNPTGTLIVNKGVPWGFLALKKLPSAKTTLSAVLARNDPPIFSLALRPKIIPFGLIRNKLAVPFARIKPSILEIDPPVTRLKICWISIALLKKAVPPVGTENSWKLWNKLLPALVPPSIMRVFPSGVTVELTGKVASGTICAAIGWVANIGNKLNPLTSHLFM